CYGLRTEALLDKGKQAHTAVAGKLCFVEVPYAIVAFPTKQDWRNDSDINLILKSTHELVDMANQRQWNRVTLSRVGCGAGRLDWMEVKEAIEPLLDNRFTIISPN